MHLHHLLGLFCGALLLLNLAQACAADAPQPWSGDLAVQQKAAENDGKPVVVLVRNPHDIGSMDAGHWVAESAEVRKAAEGFHAAMLWNFEPEARALPGKPDSGFLFMNAKGQLIATEAVPDLRAELPAIFEAIAKFPMPADDLAKAAAADPKDLARLARAVKVLASVGRADHAQSLVKLAVPQGQPLPAALAAEAEDLGWLAPLHSAQRLETLADVFTKYVKAEKPEARPSADELRLALEAVAASALYGTLIDETLVKEAKAAGEGLAALAKNPADAEAQRTLALRLEGLSSASKSRAEELKKTARDLRRAAANGGDGRPLSAQLMALFERQQPKDEAKVRELLGKLLAAPLEGKEVRRGLGAAVYAVQWLDLVDERAALMKRVVKELPAGRVPADILLDLADMAYEDGKTDEARDCWDAAIKAAGDGESPTLWRAAKAARALALGDDSPRNSRWAKREVLDVLVLVPDLETFADAVAHWDEDRFFPVLFQDDLYAPKFAAVFKPAKTVLLPSVKKADAVFSAAQIRRAILGSWTANGKLKDLPAEPSEDALRARRKDVGGDPQGVVFGDGSSGETAGALALAAGRFQGFEILPRPSVGKDEQDRRLALPNDYLSQAAAWELARSVRDGLARWDLPHENRWAAVTIAGAYPFRYSGMAWDRWGTTYALDDLLGRGEDGTRLAAVGRLLGDHARSSYQA
ncbi:MAG: hypothetical protein KIS92_11190, partial [Planctomycetota bacterium]|nr:hypothetical protein [Planctomycetota bacterium]